MVKFMLVFQKSVKKSQSFKKLLRWVAIYHAPDWFRSHSSRKFALDFCDHNRPETNQALENKKLYLKNIQKLL